MRLVDLDCPFSGFKFIFPFIFHERWAGMILVRQQGVENVNFDEVERVLGQALEKLLNQQNLLQCDLDTWSSLVCDQRRDYRESSHCLCSGT